MKKLIQTTKLILLVFIFSIGIAQGQMLLKSIDTEEAMSIKPDSIDDVPADLKVRTTSGDTATYEGFVKFDISAVEADLVKSATVICYGGQHNPNGQSVIDPYWIDMYGCNTLDWPEPFTWNTTRDMHKSDDVLASENILAYKAGYTFLGDAVTDWVIEKRQEGAEEVVFRFNAREEHPWGIWLSGTWMGMELKIEYKDIEDDASVYTDTIAKINFTLDNTFDAQGWTNVYGSSSFPMDLDNGVTISASGSGFSGGTSGEPMTILPGNVGSTYNFVEQASSEDVVFTINGLDPEVNYRFGFFASRDGSSASGDRTTTFFIKNSTEGKEGEFLITDQTYTYDDDLKGFKWINISEVEDLPDNLKSPYDYENGEVFERYEVISQPTNQAAMLSFGLWQDNGARETVSSQTLVNGPGTVGFRNSSPSGWWELDDDNPVDFTRPGDIYHFGIPLWSDQTKLVTIPDWATNNDWDRRNLYHPLVVRSSIVAVSEGVDFSGWGFWLNVNNEVSINPIGNVDSMLAISPISPNMNGQVTIRMSKLANQFGYINAMIIAKQEETSVNVMKEEGAISCYPVPARDHITISNLSSGIISVYNLMGAKVIEENIGGRSTVKISMENLRSGVYLIKVVDSTLSNAQSFKVVKE